MGAQKAMYARVLPTQKIQVQIIKYTHTHKQLKQETQNGL